MLRATHCRRCATRLRTVRAPVRAGRATDLEDAERAGERPDLLLHPEHEARAALLVPEVRSVRDRVHRVLQKR